MGVFFCVLAVLDLRVLQDTLQKLGNPWIAGTTSVSELSPDELRELCGVMNAYFYELDKDMECNDSVVAKAMQKRSYCTPKIQTPPSYWDWRNHNGHNWMTPVKWQLGCGNCWCFATIGGFEARIKIANNTPDTTPDLSEEFLTSCDNRSHGCHGGSIRYAAHFIVEKGIPDEECWPYEAKVLPCILACPDWELRAEKAKGWGSTSYVPEYKPRIMEGPMACWVTPKSDFLYYKGGVYTPIMGEKYIHAVTLCGWDDTLGAWIFKNSWGTTWGDSGYGYINYGEEHIVGPSYPTWLEVEPHKGKSERLPIPDIELTTTYPKVGGLSISPNPFTQKTVIEFSVRANGHLSQRLISGWLTSLHLQIYDLAGRLVKNFPITNHQSPITSIIWDGRNESGEKLSPGVYFIRLKSGENICVKKAILL